MEPDEQDKSDGFTATLTEEPEIDEQEQAQESDGADRTEPGIIHVELIVPMLAEPTNTYATRHVDLSLNPEQGMTLKRLFVALDREGERLAPAVGSDMGRRVATVADAVRWLIESICDAAK